MEWLELQVRFFGDPLGTPILFAAKALGILLALRLPKQKPRSRKWFRSRPGIGTSRSTQAAPPQKKKREKKTRMYF